MSPDIKSTGLVEVLKHFPLQLIDASLVTPKQQYRAPSLQKFIDYLLQNLGSGLGASSSENPIYEK